MSSDLYFHTKLINMTSFNKGVSRKKPSTSTTGISLNRVAFFGAVATNRCIDVFAVLR